MPQESIFLLNVSHIKQSLKYISFSQQFLSLSNFSESDIKHSQLGCGIYQHAQLDGQHSHPGLLLWLLLSLPQCLGSSGMTHVPQANFGNIQPLSLHTHASHVLPDSLTAENRKVKESCYCVAWKANEVWGGRVWKGKPSVRWEWGDCNRDSSSCVKIKEEQKQAHTQRSLLELNNPNLKEILWTLIYTNV